MLLRLLVAATFAVLPGAAPAADLAGPIVAEVLSVTDGDTLRVRATVWLDMDVVVAVRIRGIDAPELRGDCSVERTGAEAAAAALGAVVGDGPVLLTAVEGDKYFGRVLADVETADGQPVAEALLAAGVVRPYAGGRRDPWC